jgi:hypothetical protein
MARGVDVAAILDRGKAAGVTDWVVAGYAPQALDFIAKKSALGVPGRVIMSDGCYGEWLQATRLNDGWLSFPTPAKLSSHIAHHEGARRGYTPIGHDALVLLANAINEAKRHNGNRDTIRTMIATGVAARTAADDLLFAYVFDGRGENLDAQFGTFPLANGGANQ